ncbi:hypothetical protein M0R72_08900 [Candidatus Pacearchaeota archaeon]|nr:hypothetical protein [Candidatus Pacearchaeota archaeon]
MSADVVMDREWAREWACLECRKNFATFQGQRVFAVRCPFCKSGDHLRALSAEPSPVNDSGAGGNPDLDLGLELLLDAQV